ncbi:MAG: chemotaxis protein CheW [Acidobacteria bacterium]|nr:chemotaxis protein CheW [Acidobacteriota bacterium]
MPLDTAATELRKPDELLQLVSFRLADEEFGIDILKVQEIIRMVDMTRVPNSPEFVEGVINLRGRIIPIIALRKRFGVEPRPPDKRTRIMVVEVDRKTIGFIVDSVSEVLRIPRSTVEPTPEVVSSVNAEYISGVGKLEDRLLILLDLNRLLTGSERSLLEGAAR